MTVKEMALPWRHGGAFLLVNSCRRRVISFVTNSCYAVNAMTEPTNSLLLEHLKRIQTELSEVKRDVRDVKSEIVSLRTIMGEFLKADARREGSIATLELRVERIERRLDLQGSTT